MTTPTLAAATLTVHDADEMTPEGRRKIATWLRQQANFLVAHGPEMAPTFRARYMYNYDQKLHGPKPRKLK